MIGHKQSGYGVLLVLVVLLSSSVGVLRYSVIHNPGRSTLQHAMMQQLPLRKSRQFLLSYAVAYPYLYGPQGSGPGHLPCPDTDSTTLSGFASARVSDGPDPPCGQQQIAIGHLPRQVSLSGSRYAFSDLASARLSYEVDSRVINNPVNRVVNPELLVDDRGTPSLLASISLSGLDGAYHAQKLTAAAITPAAFLLAIRPTVAAWVIERLESLATDKCVPSLFMTSQLQSDPLLALFAGNVESDLVTGPHADGDARCGQINRFLAMCSSHHPEDELAASHKHDHSYDNELPLLLSLADSIPTLDACPADLVSLLSIEKVPMKRHWFFRNRWQEWVHVETKGGCESNLSSECTLSYRSDNALQHLAEPLVLHWTL